MSALHASSVHLAAFTSAGCDRSTSCMMTGPGAIWENSASSMLFDDGLPWPHVTTTAFLNASMVTAMWILFLERLLLDTKSALRTMSESVR